jgi:predicted DNA-binding transcriptional regulator YafY
MTMKVGLSPDLIAWILSWGSEAEVVEPRELRDSIARSLRASVKLYAAS